jgi:hypothetical protein
LPSEEVALLRDFILAICHELVGDIGFRAESEEAVPGLGAAGENYVSGGFILPDENFAAFKTKIYREANCLTSAVKKEFCCARHERAS